MTDSFCNAMSRRRRLALENKPLMRNTLINLYPELPFEYINSLRKMEILKYSNNTQASKGNNFTKKELWSRLVKGNVQRISDDNIRNIEDGNICYT